MEGEAGMRFSARSLVLLLAVAFLATACGRMGPIRPPGPAELPQDHQFYARDDRNQGTLWACGTCGSLGAGGTC